MTQSCDLCGHDQATVPHYGQRACVDCAWATFVDMGRHAAQPGHSNPLVRCDVDDLSLVAPRVAQPYQPHQRQLAEHRRAMDMPVLPPSWDVGQKAAFRQAWADGANPSVLDFQPDQAEGEEDAA
jgi:hypothetical protein